MTRGKILLPALAILLLAGSGTLFLGWGTFRTWYVLAGLRKADDEARAAWVERAVALGPAAVDALLSGLTDEPGGEAHAEALAAMAGEWGGADERTARLAEKVARRCPDLPPAARARALRVMADCCPGGDAVRGWSVRLLDEACGEADPAVLESALVLACRLLPDVEQALPAARRLARAGLASPAEGACVQAIALSIRPGMDLLEEVTAKMKAGTPAVRRAAVLAGGTAEGTREDTLLACLHDEDAEVRRVASSALLARGLRPEHVEMGRLFTHPKALTRLDVLDRLREVSDVDPVAWIKRLSLDPSPAVRTAAARVIGEHLASELGDRLDQMAKSDPSPTVAQLARYYLATRREAVPVGGRR